MKKKTESKFLLYLKSTNKMTVGWPEWKKEALKPTSVERDTLHNAQVAQDRRVYAGS